MAIAFLLDENVPARVWRAIQRHNVSGEFPIDVVRIGEPADLSLSADDPAVLLWTEREGHILVTENRSTMPVHLTAHLQAGHRSPGVFLIRRGIGVPDLLEFLVLVAYASKPEEWQDRIEYVP